jgi:hypothetical protein
MESRGIRYFIGFVIVVALIVFLFVIIFGGSDNKTKVANSSRVLSSYATSSSEVKMTIDGPTNASADHRQVVVHVDQNQVLFQEKHGYDGDVAKSQNFANSPGSYQAFLRSLEHANFTKGDASHMNADERGYCPLGSRYIFELIDAGKIVQRYWTTSCGSPKTFLGDTALNIELFQKQVPGYFDLTDDASL